MSILYGALFIILQIWLIAGKQGCLPGCSCGQQSSGTKTESRFKVISCQTFPTTALPPEYNSFRGTKSPEKLTRGTFAPMQPQYIVTLDLCESGIKEVEEESLVDFKRLATLKLSFNKISTIDANSFAGCDQLRELYLDGNGVQTLGTNCFTKLGNLKALYLQNNKLHTLPNLPKGLTKLDISNNVIGQDLENYDIPRTMRYLDLCGNNIKTPPLLGEAPIRSLCVSKSLSARNILTSIQNLTLAAATYGEVLTEEKGNQLAEMKDLQHLKIIAYTIETATFLEEKLLLTLVLQDIVAKENIATDIIEALHRQNLLKTIDFTSSPTLAKALLKEVGIWEVSTQLQNVVLRDCNITSLGAFQGSGLPIKLDLSMNPLHCDCDLVNKLENTEFVGDESTTVCATPPTYHGAPLKSLGKRPCTDVIGETLGNNQGPRDVNNGNNNDLTVDKNKPDIGNNFPGFNDDDDSKNNNNAGSFGDSNFESTLDQEEPSSSGQNINNVHNNDTNNGQNLDENGDNSNIHGGDEIITPSANNWNHGEEGTTDNAMLTDKEDEHAVDEETLIIVGIVVAILTLIGAIIFSVLFFYFRRRGNAGIEGGNAAYRKHTSSRDDLVKTKK